MYFVYQDYTITRSHVIDEKSFAFEFLPVSCAARFANATVAPNDKKVKTPTCRAPPDLPDFLIVIIPTIYEPIFIKLSILFTLALFSSSSKFSVEIIRIDRAIRHRDISTIVLPLFYPTMTTVSIGYCFSSLEQKKERCVPVAVGAFNLSGI